MSGMLCYACYVIMLLCYVCYAFKPGPRKPPPMPVRARRVRRAQAWGRSGFEAGCVLIHTFYCQISIMISSGSSSSSSSIIYWLSC